MTSIEFKHESSEVYRLWDLYPIPNLVRVDRHAFYELHRRANEGGLIKNYHEAIWKLEERLPTDIFTYIHSSVNALYRYSSNLFPAFRELLPEFLASEWLALVDIRQKFYREHIVHQTQTAVVVKKLLLKEMFQIKHIKKHLDLNWVPPGSNGLCCLLDICALIMMKEPLTGPKYKKHRSPAFIQNYARMLGLCDYFITPNDMLQQFKFWHETIYVTAVTAACYHDIGYVFNFAGTMLRPLLPFCDFCSTGCFDAEYLQRTASNTLYMHNFTGIYDWHTHPGVRLKTNELHQIIQSACAESHGLYSAHAFICLNEHLRNKDLPPNPWAQLIMQWAASAMLMHDLSNIRKKIKPRADKGDSLHDSLYNDNYLRVMLTEDPVSFIVTMADQIQSYNRYNTYVKKLPPKGKKKGVGSDSINLNFEAPIERVKLNYDETSREAKLTHGFSSDLLPDRKKTYQIMHEHNFFPKMNKDFFNYDYGYLDIPKWLFESLEAE